MWMFAVKIASALVAQSQGFYRILVRCVINQLYQTAADTQTFTHTQDTVIRSNRHSCATKVELWKKVSFHRSNTMARLSTASQAKIWKHTGVSGFTVQLLLKRHKVAGSIEDHGVTNLQRGNKWSDSGKRRNCRCSLLSTPKCQMFVCCRGKFLFHCRAVQ